MKLDLACGANPHEGYEGVDCREMTQPWRVNLEQFPWPWEDGSVEELICSHYVEHCPDLVAFMNECHRILEPGGTLRILCPYQHSDRAWQDPTHIRALNFKSWDYYDAQLRAGLGPEYADITADFEMVKQVAIINGDVAAQFGEEGVPPWLLQHGVNVIDDIDVTLRKRAA